jgi:hypothetical protein
MRNNISIKNPLFLGLFVGLVFGSVDLLMTWLRPLEDDSPGALLRFYGPMFLVWILVSFRSARANRGLSAGVAAGLAVAVATFCVFVVLNFLRVNLFLSELTGRPDWQNMMLRFRASGSESLRVWVNLDYLKGTPFKIGFFTAIGGVMGILGGTAGHLTRGRQRFPLVS